MPLFFLLHCYHVQQKFIITSTVIVVILIFLKKISIHICGSTALKIYSTKKRILYSTSFSYLVLWTWKFSLMDRIEIDQSFIVMGSSCTDCLNTALCHKLYKQRWMVASCGIQDKRFVLLEARQLDVHAFKCCYSLRNSNPVPFTSNFITLSIISDWSHIVVLVIQSDHNMNSLIVKPSRVKCKLSNWDHEY